jgi:hypothetical protein
MIVVQFPPPQFRIKKEGEKVFIFDEIRRRWLLLTEEEWVRQNFVAYLKTELHYPTSLIALEKEILLNGLKKRFDILVYDADHQPWLMVECKAPSVSLDEDVLQQALRYNISIPVSFIVVTNGEKTMGWEKQGANLTMINTLPVFPS